MPETTVTADLPKIDSGATPIVLVDSIQGVSVHEGMVALNLTAVRFAVPNSELPQLFHQAVARLVMPSPAFSRIAVFLHNQYLQMVKDGVVEAVPESNDV